MLPRWQSSLKTIIEPLLTDCHDRSAEQVTGRLDGLVQKIHAIQGPNMHGESPADVVLGRYYHVMLTYADNAKV